jgi:hypothetical protein
MDILYIQLAKTGDLVNLLPVAKIMSDRGHDVGILACEPFADVLDGVSYVEKVIFKGEPWELGKAVEFAKSICPNYVVTQVVGSKEQVLEHAYKPKGQTTAMADSFAREQWHLAGFGAEWGLHTPVFDKRNPEREQGWMPKKGKGKPKPIMLVALDSASSPFEYRDLLWKIIKLEYTKDFNIVDLSLIAAERFYDLLGLMEAAHCLITVDTAVLHLAAAAPKLPVVALVQDTPLYWNGSAWRPQHEFFCRYSDFPKRVLELFTAIENIGSANIGRTTQVFAGKIRKNDYWNYFAIQNGSAPRDSVNILHDDKRFPMLRAVIRMTLQKVPSGYIYLTAEKTKFDHDQPPVNTEPVYAFRMNRTNGKDMFFPCADLFGGDRSFWEKILPEVPDLVMDDAAFWNRALLEVFKKHGAKQIEGIYQNV